MNLGNENDTSHGHEWVVTNHSHWFARLDKAGSGVRSESHSFMNTLSLNYPVEAIGLHGIANTSHLAGWWNVSSGISLPGSLDLNTRAVSSQSWQLLLDQDFKALCCAIVAL